MRQGSGRGVSDRGVALTRLSPSVTCSAVLRLPNSLSPVHPSVVASTVLQLAPASHIGLVAPASRRRLGATACREVFHTATARFCQITF